MREGDERLLLISTVWVVLKLAPFLTIKTTLHAFFIVKVFAVTVGSFTVSFLVRWPTEIAFLPIILEEGLLLEWCLVVFLDIQMRGSCDWSVLIFRYAFIFSVFIAHLAASLSSAKLPLGFKSIVPVNSDCSSINSRSIEGIHCQPCFLPSCVLDEAKAARLHLDFVQAHDQVDNLTTL